MSIIDKINEELEAAASTVAKALKSVGKKIEAGMEKGCDWLNEGGDEVDKKSDQSIHNAEQKDKPLTEKIDSGLDKFHDWLDEKADNLREKIEGPEEAEAELIGRDSDANPTHNEL